LTGRAAARDDDPPSGASPFALLAYPLLPAEPERRGIVVEAPPDWSLARAALEADADVVVWGRLPEPPAPLAEAAGRAARRELALRTLGRRLHSRQRMVAVNRLAPRRLRPGRVRSALRTALRSGALVEVSAPPGGARILDAVAEAAGVTPSRALHAGSGGVLLVEGRLPDGTGAILRIARAGAGRDPGELVGTLELLAGGTVLFTPRLHAHGHTAGASWTAERALSGRTPGRVTDSLIRQVAEVCAAFPRGDGPPTAAAEDLAAVQTLLPGRAALIGRLAAHLATPLEGLPSILRHGDLWAGNVLVDPSGSLSGLVDWDAAHPAAVPGADLLQLVATEFRRAARLSLGSAFLAKPWRFASFARATADYWPRLGIKPNQAELEAVGAAWWATEVHGTLARLPHRASDARWVETNVDAVLSGLGY
jgi:Phosphotransferase enzyme family